MRSEADPTESGKDVRIAVLMTTYNRAETTRTALQSLLVSAKQADVTLNVYLTDASSSDGTVAVAKSVLPSVDIEVVSADNFWADGMRRSWERAQSESYDLLLWLNDDVVLDADALPRALVALGQAGGSAIVGGATRGPDGSLSYGGYSRGSFWKRLDFHRLSWSTETQRCEALNGNFVLIPRKTDFLLGGFPKPYSHGMADFDYTLRASRSGHSVFVMGMTIGVCSNNIPVRTAMVGRLTRLKAKASKKDLPVREWFVFCRRHGGIAAPLFFAKPYIDEIRKSSV